MKNNYEMLKLNNDSYDFLIIATSYENPLSSITEIVEEIQMQKATLLFDLALINGTAANRYIKCEYEAGRNFPPSCSIAEGVGNAIRKISQNYFFENEEIVRNSVIPDSLKYLLKSGMV